MDEHVARGLSAIRLSAVAASCDADSSLANVMHSAPMLTAALRPVHAASDTDADTTDRTDEQSLCARRRTALLAAVPPKLHPLNLFARSSKK